MKGLLHLGRYSPVEQDIGFCILYHGLMDFGDILVIKLVPLAIDHILAVGYIMPTCIKKKYNTAEIQSAGGTQAWGKVSSTTGLAASRNRRGNKTIIVIIIPVQASFAGAGQSVTVTMVCLPGKGPLGQRMGEATAAAENLSEAVEFTFQRAEAEQGWETEEQASHCTLSQKRDSRTLCLAHTRLVPVHLCHILPGRRTYCLLCRDGR